MITSIITAPYKIDIREVETPKPQVGEVLVKIKTAAICASDIQVYHGLHKYVSYPIVQGHEAVGYIEAVGCEVKSIKTGDLVVIQPQLGCGECFACMQDRVNVCENLKHYGISKPGHFAEYSSVPEWNAVKLPAGMDTDVGVFIEPFSVACNAIEKGNIKPDYRVVVLGAGTIGNLVAQAAKYRGAEVIITDVMQSKLDIAKSHGIDYCVNTAKLSLKEEIKRIFGDKGVHVIFECAAVKTTFEQAVNCASKASSIVLVGNFKEPILFEIPRIQRKEIELKSVMGTSRKNFLESVEMLSSRKIDLSGMISARFPLRDLQKAYAFIDEHKDTLKVLVDID